MPRQRTTLQRLFGYATPYRGRLAWAVAGMIVYAAGSAGLAYLIKPIFDSVLPKQEQVAFIAWALVGVYLLKGIGSYVSSYLMADVGQRVVMDLRNALYRHIPGQSAGFFAHGATGRLLSRINNDVGQVQQAVSETAGDLARETLSLVGFAALLFYYDARMTLLCLIGAPLMELIGGVGMAAALVYGSGQIASGSLTTGQFALFISALFLMYGPAKKLSRVNANLQQAIAASERIFEMLDTHSEVVEM